MTETCLCDNDDETCAIIESSPDGDRRAPLTKRYRQTSLPPKESLIVCPRAESETSTSQARMLAPQHTSMDPSRPRARCPLAVCIRKDPFHNQQMTQPHVQITLNTMPTIDCQHRRCQLQVPRSSMTMNQTCSIHSSTVLAPRHSTTTSFLHLPTRHQIDTVGQTFRQRLWAPARLLVLRLHASHNPLRPRPRPCSSQILTP